MSRHSSGKGSKPIVLTLVAATLLQIFCLVLFVGDFVVSLLGIATINWTLRELIEIGAAIGLTLGTCLGIFALRRVLQRNVEMEGQLRAASGAFAEVMEERFKGWGLTPAEKDVALFAIKGVPTSQIAQMRGVSEGTIKAQTSAIYRKAGVAGRPQLLSLFIDDLMDGPVVRAEAAE